MISPQGVIMGILNIDSCFGFVDIAPIIPAHAQIVCVKCEHVRENIPKECQPPAQEQHETCKRSPKEF